MMRKAGTLLGLLLLVQFGMEVVTDAGARSPRETRLPAASLVVDPHGSPSSDCRPATPCTSIARAARVARAGDIVVIRPGTYTGDVVVHGSGTPDRRIVFAAEVPGTVVLVGHIQPAGWPGIRDGNVAANPYVTWRGLVVRNAGDGAGNPADTCQPGRIALGASEGWRIEDMVFEQGQSAIRVSGHGVVIERSTFQDFARYALSGAGVDNVVIRNNVIRRINTGGALEPACGAVTKFLFTNRLLVEGNQSYENVGPGFWLDWDNANYIVRHNVFRDNRGRTRWWEGPGLWLEGNPASNGKVHDNTFAGNTGSGLGILETVGVEVYNNTFAGNRLGIELRNIRRDSSDARVLRDLHIHDNTFNSWGDLAAVYTSAGEWTGWSVATHNIRFDRNTYKPSPDQTLFQWLGRKYRRLDAVRKVFGFEVTRTVSP